MLARQGARVVFHADHERVLHVGPTQPRHRANEPARLGRVRGEHAAPPQQVVQWRQHDTPRAAQRQRVRLGARVQHRDRHGRVVLQIRANSQALVSDRDAVALQLSCRADAREHQQLRRIHRARGKNHFCGRCEKPRLPRMPHTHAHGARTFEFDALDERFSEQRQIGARPHRVQKSARAAPAHAASPVQVEQAEAVLLSAVEILVSRVPGLHGGLHKRIGERIRLREALHVELAACAVIRRSAARVVLVALVHRQHIGVTPARIAQRRPIVIVRSMAADIDRAVHGRAAAQQLAARAGDAAPVHAGPAAELMLPVIARVRQQEDVADRQCRFDVDRELPVRRPGLDECDAARGVGRQAIRQHATCGAGADDDEVKPECVHADSIRSSSNSLVRSQ